MKNSKNDKIQLITNKTLIVGVDIAREFNGLNLLIIEV